MRLKVTHMVAASQQIIRHNWLSSTKGLLAAGLSPTKSFRSTLVAKSPLLSIDDASRSHLNSDSRRVGLGMTQKYMAMGRNFLDSRREAKCEKNPGEVQV